MNLEERIRKIVDALADRKAVDVKTYDVRGVSGLCDAFVVATGTAAPHLKGLATGVRTALHDVGESPYHASGDPDSGWIVVDFVDIIVHIFSPEARAYYALEKLWDPSKPIV